MVKIITWKEEYSKDFIDLSMEWLEKYVRVEEADRKILYNPYDSILKDGGIIFFANDEGENIGTVSLIRMNENTFELAKLAVTEIHKRKGIGQLLMDEAISYAKMHHADKIVLFTNSKLEGAIGLYKKNGFSIVPLIDNEYEESDMKMELTL